MEIVSVNRHRSISKKRRERLIEVQRLYFVEAISMREIAEKLGVSVMTIMKDVELLRREGRTTAKKLREELFNDIDGFIAEMHSNYKSRIRKLWEDYDKADSSFARVKILKEIRENEKQYIDIMQKCGVLHKEPEKHLHGVMYVSRLGKEDLQKEAKEKETVEIINQVEEGETDDKT